MRPTLGIIIGTFVVTVFCVFIISCYRKRRARRQRENYDRALSEMYDRDRQETEMMVATLSRRTSKESEEFYRDLGNC